MGKITRRSSAVLAAAVAATLAVAPSALAEQDVDLGANTVARIAGNDRVLTSVAASKALTASGWTGDTVIIAQSGDYPDALTASTLADALDAPVLLNNSHVLNNYVRDELRRLAAGTVENVVIIGGTSAIHASVETAIRDMKNTAGEDVFESVLRVGGDDRYGTAIEVAIRTQAEYNPALGDVLEDAEEALAVGLAAEAEAERLYGLYVAAWDVYTAARDAYAEALAEAAALRAERTRVAEDLAELPGAPVTEAQIIAATDAVAVAQGNVDDAQAALDAVEDTLTSVDEMWRDDLVEDTTPMDEVIEALDAEEAEVAEAALEALNITDASGTTLAAFQTAARAAIGAGGDLVTDLAAAIVTRDGLQEDLDELLVQLIEWQETVDANAPILEELARLAVAIAAADERAEELGEAMDEAWDAYDDARTEWEIARAAVPSFDQMEILLADVADARADLVEDVDEVFLTTGRDFADALSAGPAAGEEEGVILLTAGETLVDATAGFIAASEAEVHAIGGPSARAFGATAVTQIVGDDRYETAALTAAEFFPNATDFAVASGVVFPDAVTASGFIANLDGPLLLTWPGALPTATVDYFNAEAGVGAEIFVFGGGAVISNNVVDELGRIAPRN